MFTKSINCTAKVLRFLAEGGDCTNETEHVEELLLEAAEAAERGELVVLSFTVDEEPK